MTATTTAFTRVLCPTDFSDHSKAAVSYAAALAASYGARLHLLHVLTPFPVVAPVADLPIDSRVWASVDTQAREDLDAEARRIRHPGVEIETTVRQGDAVAETLRVAGQWHADLIVLGTHGRGGFERLVLGSVAEKVLRRAPCAVTTVPVEAAAGVADGVARLTHVLCAHDGSDASTAGVQFAITLARRTGARLTMVSVVEALPDGHEFSGEQYAAYRAGRDAHAREALDRAVPADVRVQCNVHDRIVYGHPAQQILEVAKQERPDLLVMGVRGRGPFDLAVFGSTTNLVVRHAPCPVLTVRPPATGA